MQRSNLRFCVLVVTLSLFSALMFFIKVDQTPRELFVDIFKMPMVLKGWQAENILIEKKVKDILETEFVLSRKYSKGLDSIQLDVIYYNNKQIAFHLPEGCFLGQGSRLIERNAREIELLDKEHFWVNQLVTTDGKGHYQMMLYFFETGKLKTNNSLPLRLQMIKDKFKLKKNSAALIRVTIPVKENIEESFLVLQEFLRVIVPILPEYLI